NGDAYVVAEPSRGALRLVRQRVLLGRRHVEGHVVRPGEDDDQKADHGRKEDFDAEPDPMRRGRARRRHTTPRQARLCSERRLTNRKKAVKTTKYAMSSV